MGHAHTEDVARAVEEATKLNEIESPPFLRRNRFELNALWLAEQAPGKHAPEELHNAYKALLEARDELTRRARELGRAWHKHAVAQREARQRKHPDSSG